MTASAPRAIVFALIDLVDEESDVHSLAARIPTTTDPRELLEIAVAISHNINQRCEDIVSAIFSAASVEPEMELTRHEARRRHREGHGRLAAQLAALDALRPDVGADKAADIIAALTDPQVVRTFVLAYGWSWDEWHVWAVDALARIVLTP